MIMRGANTYMRMHTYRSVLLARRTAAGGLGVKEAEFGPRCQHTMHAVHATYMATAHLDHEEQELPERKHRAECRERSAAGKSGLQHDKSAADGQEADARRSVPRPGAGAAGRVQEATAGECADDAGADCDRPEEDVSGAGAHLEDVRDGLWAPVGEHAEEGGVEGIAEDCEREDGPPAAAAPM